ncbi:MAG: FAD binding domain-containing protein [Treponema sp.]|jgi:CO/xanthine dehydrogenase FAD-binding subunit|nr:FAD binding domain-containing protein [Treponema sp.]
MDAQLNQVFFPVSLHELFSTWSRFPDAVPYAGGTNIISRQGKNIISLPKVILCMDKLEDLHRVTRTEQYLEIGALVKLNRLIRLGKKVPEIIRTCLENIAGVQLRNIATVGGNLCSAHYLYDLSAPFTALDAQYELRNAHRTRWVSASRFHSTEEHNVLENQELLTRVRLPLHQWDYSIYKKFNTGHLQNNEVLVFLAKAQKTILTDIRVVYKANTILRDKNSEDILNGKILPLNRRTALDFIENWKIFLSGREDVSEFSKNALLYNIKENVFILSE